MVKELVIVVLQWHKGAFGQDVEVVRRKIGGVLACGVGAAVGIKDGVAAATKWRSIELGGERKIYVWKKRVSVRERKENEGCSMWKKTHA